MSIPGAASNWDQEVLSQGGISRKCTDENSSDEAPRARYVHTIRRCPNIIANVPQVPLHPSQTSNYMRHAVSTRNHCDSQLRGDKIWAEMIDVMYYKQKQKEALQAWALLFETSQRC